LSAQFPSKRRMIQPDHRGESTERRKKKRRGECIRKENMAPALFDAGGKGPSSSPIWRRFIPTLTARGKRSDLRKEKRG